MVGLGYDRRSIRPNHEIPVSRSEPRWTVDGVAFCNRLAQAQNAGVTIFDLSMLALTEDDAANRLRLTTAPFHLVFNESRGGFFVWATGPKDRVVLADRVAPERLADRLSDFAADLRPETVRRVKQGLDSFRHPLLCELNPLQLTFWAEKANGKLLTNYFRHVVNELRKAGLTDAGEQSKLAAQLLAARILVDTGVMEQCTDVGDIPDAAEAKRFREYFDRSLLQRHKRRAQDAYNNTSIVLRIEGRGTSALLGGDLEPSGWSLLKNHCARADLAIADVLKFPHHGAWKNSDGSAADANAFLQDVRAKAVVISVGTEQRRYSHPNPHVFDAIRSRNLHLLCTQATKKCGGRAVLRLRDQVIPELESCAAARGVLALVSPKGCPCAGTVVIDLDTTADVIQPIPSRHADRIVKKTFAKYHRCAV